jgi:Domain of unknown function (DUF4440)
MKSGRRLLQAIAIVLITATPAAAQDVSSLRAADAEQHKAASKNDGKALAAMAHDNFRLFAPEGYVGNRERLIARFQSAETGYVRFERTAEEAVVTSNVGVVMGREIIQRTNQQPVNRRFTNIWLWENGRWQWLARHAQVDLQKETK